jgi:hypothetical protein
MYVIDMIDEYGYLAEGMRGSLATWPNWAGIG